MADPRGKPEPTLRSEILSIVLDCIDREQYDDFEKYLIFGGSLDELLWDADHPGRREEADKDARARAIRSDVAKAIEEIRAHRGRTTARRRASLEGPAKEGPAIRALDNLKQAGAGELADLLRSTLDAPLIPEAASEEKLDGLDRAFAKEVLGKLPKIVARAASLDEIGDEEVEKEQMPADVKKYWEEAHRCYLYGFPVACAVLCRAILESALEEVIDPDGRIGQLLRDDAKKSGKEKQSYIGRLVEEAAKKHILTDDRPKCAIEVRDAGNDAIHKYEEFEERLRDPLRGIAYIVDSTRKILIDLYSDRS